MIEEYLSNKLRARKDKGIHRTFPHRETLIDFASNDYLGLARNKDLQSKIHQENLNSQATSGSTGSRLLTGTSKEHIKLEAYLSDFFDSEASLLFNSGYVANLAILSALPQRGDTIIYDDYCHASIKDGMRLSQADFYRFKHNDLEDLEKQLQKAKGNSFVVVESVYSMDGDLCLLKEISELTEKYKAGLIIDEAHGTGVIGTIGQGLTKTLEIDALAVIYTFGKAVGIHGACISASKTLIDFLINFSRPFIYTTAPSPSHLIGIRTSLDFIRQHSESRNLLQENIHHFSKEIARVGLNESVILNSSPIQGILGPGSEEVKELSAELRKNGFNALPILSPTVPEGKERIRICLHSYNSKEEITSLIESVKELMA